MKEILSKGAALFLGHMLVSIAGLVLVPMIIRFGSVETLGAFSLSSAVLSFLFGISRFGVGFRARRYMPGLDDPVARASLFYPQLCFQGLSLLLLGIMASLAWPHLIAVISSGSNSLAPGLTIAYLFSNLFYSQYTDYFRYTHRLCTYTIATSITPFLALAFMAALYSYGNRLSVNGVILCQTLAAMCIGSLLVLMAFQEIGLKLALPLLEDLKGDIRLGLPLIFAFIVDVLLASSDRFVIGGMLSIKEVGFYVPAYSLGMLMMLLPRMLGVLLPPIIARDVDTGQRQNAENTIEFVIRGYLLVSMTFAVGAAVLGRPVLSLYATEDVAAAAWPIVPIVATSSIFYGLMLIYSNVLSVQLRTRDMFHATVAAAVLNLGLNLILMSVFKHVVVAAVTTLISYIIAWIMVRSKVKACWPIIFPAIFLMRASAVAVLTGGVAYGVHSMALSFWKPMAALLLSLALGVIAFSLFVGVFGLVDRAKYTGIYAFLRRSRNNTVMRSGD